MDNYHMYCIVGTSGEMMQGRLGGGSFRAHTVTLIYCHILV